LRWLPGVLISAIALYAVFKLVQFQDLQKAFASANWQFLVLIFVLDVLSLVIRGKAWQVILGKGVPWSQTFFGVNEGYFLNNLFPLRAGEIGRSIFVGKSSGLGTFQVLSSIVIERAFDIGYAAILALLTLPLVVGLAWVKSTAWTILVVVLIGFISLFFIARNQALVIGWLEKLSAGKAIFEKYLLSPIKKVIQGFATMADPKQFFLSFFWMGASWFSWFVIYNVMIRQILPSAPLWAGAFIGAILALGAAIPSAPAALGVYEASMVAAVVVLGGDESSALAYAIIMHFMQFISVGIFGIWGLIREGQSLQSLFSAVKINEATEDPQVGIVEDKETK
jgi:uncharacterized protein (TIRG00374 family)